MTPITTYINKALRLAGDQPSLAKQLGVHQQSISRYKLGQRIPENAIALRLARFINVPELLVVLSAMYARATCKDGREFIEMLWKRLHGLR